MNWNGDPKRRVVRGDLLDWVAARRTRNMDLLVLDGDGVHAEFLRDKVDRVQAILDLLDFGVLGDSARRGDRRGQIERGDSGHLEGQLALAADLGDGDRLPLALDLLALPVGALAGNLHGEGRPVDVVIGKLEIDDVIARLGWLVRNVERSVVLVRTLDLGLARAFDGQRQTTVAGIAGVHGEHIIGVGLALLQRVAGHEDLLGVTDFSFTNLHLER